MKKFKDIKVGDIILCNGKKTDSTLYVHMYVELIEKRKEYKTDTNPQGIVVYGRNFENEGPAIKCTEKDFLRLALKGDEEKIHIPLLENMTRIIVRERGGLIFAYNVMGKGEEMSNKLIGNGVISDSPSLLEWSMKGRGQSC